MTSPDEKQPLMPAMPPMSDAVLDDAALACLFRDIGELAQVDEIIIKHRPGHVNDAQQVTLKEAHDLIRSRQVKGVQIRYRHDGAHWWDTLMPIGEGVRLVRVRHDFPPR